MGRDSSTAASKFVVATAGIAKLLAALKYPGDPDRDSTENLRDCLADFGLVHEGADKRGRPTFRACDGDRDESIDWEFLERIAPFLVRGSYYEERGEQIIVLEYCGKGAMEVSVYEPAVDSRTGKEKRGTLIDQYDHEAGLGRPTGDTAAGDVFETMFPERRERKPPPRPDPLVVDTAHWHTKDTAWMAQRKREWNELECLFDDKSNKGRQIVKRYFLSGRLPDWVALNESWSVHDETGRHLDLFSLLYCHPSRDFEVLKPLRDAYLQGAQLGRTVYDVRIGCSLLLTAGFERPSCNGRSRYVESKSGELVPVIPEINGDLKLFFRLFVDDANDPAWKENALHRNLAQPYLVRAELLALYGLRWMELDALNEHGTRMLLQHRSVLECLHHDATTWDERRVERFMNGGDDQRWRRLLHAIHDFDEAKEGAIARSRFVTTMVQMLDSYPWNPTLKDVWKSISSARMPRDESP